MNKLQTKMLKKIEKIGLLDSSVLNNEEKEIISFLNKNGFVSQKANPKGGPKPAYKITELGKSALHEEKINNLKLFIPNFLSVISLLISVTHIILSILGVL